MIRERDETIVAQAQLAEERWAGRAAYRHFGRSGSLNGRAQVAPPRGEDDL